MIQDLGKIFNKKYILRSYGICAAFADMGLTYGYKPAYLNSIITPLERAKESPYRAHEIDGTILSVNREHNGIDEEDDVSHTISISGEPIPELEDISPNCPYFEDDLSTSPSADIDNDDNNWLDADMDDNDSAFGLILKNFQMKN